MDVAVGIKELWSLVVSEVGALDVAVGGCRESETDVVDMLVHPGGQPAAHGIDCQN